jgi:uroporphyrinogen decarboxylase
MSHFMSKIDIVNQALNGERATRIPFSCWYHFGNHYDTGAKHAETELGFYRHYDLDFLKLMDDYGYPFPEGFDWLRTSEDYEKLTVIKTATDFEGFRRQLECIRAVAKELKGEAYFVDTIFSPFTWLRNYGIGSWRKTMHEQRDIFVAAMDVVAENLAKYVIEIANAGVNGIFYSQPAAEPGFTTREEFRELIKPFDLRILNAVRELPFNVLHAHGSGLYMEEFYDYPVKVVNWSDRFMSNPSLADVRTSQPEWCLMGGINEAIAKESDPLSIESEIDDAYTQLEGRGFICTPGCSLKTNIWESHIWCMRERVKTL